MFFSIERKKDLRRKFVFKILSHAKLQPIQTIRLVRVMDVIRFLPQHLVNGGYLYRMNRCFRKRQRKIAEDVCGRLTADCLGRLYEGISKRMQVALDLQGAQ